MGFLNSASSSVSLLSGVSLDGLPVPSALRILIVGGIVSQLEEIRSVGTHHPDVLLG